MFRPLLARLLLAGIATVASGLLAISIARCSLGSRLTQTVEASDGDGVTWRGQEAFVVDDVLGLRPRPSSIEHLSRWSLGGLDVDEVTKHRDEHGFLRREVLPTPLDRPCALLLGDSHIDGVVDTWRNVGTLLERGRVAGGEAIYVLNAACGHYSLWQYVLRARGLLPRWRPRAVVVVVFLGNDLLDLDNPLMPHLDDELQPQPAAEPLDGGETTTARLVGLSLPASYQPLFWQGLNQAALAQQQPERLPVWMVKAAHAVDAMQAAAAAHNAAVVWVLLPSFDLVFPECVAALNPATRALVASGMQRRVRDGFARVLDERGIAPVDLEPLFRSDGRLDLYALDFHISEPAHELLAEAIGEHLHAVMNR